MFSETWMMAKVRQFSRQIWCIYLSERFDWNIGQVIEPDVYRAYLTICKISCLPAPILGSWSDNELLLILKGMKKKILTMLSMREKMMMLTMKSIVDGRDNDADGDDIDENNWWCWIKQDDYRSIRSSSTILHPLVELFPLTISQLYLFITRPYMLYGESIRFSLCVFPENPVRK